MCGIVGYTGEASATPILVEGLTRMEYRGYDSAGVAVEQDVPFGQRRRVLSIIDMPVGGINELFARREDAVIRHHREIQHHLVHLGLAVAPDAAEFVFQAVQHRDDLFRRVVPGQVVPGAVVKQVAQHQQPVSPLPLKGLHHLFAVVSRPVQVGRDHPFHGAFPPFLSGFIVSRNGRLKSLL